MVENRAVKLFAMLDWIMDKFITMPYQNDHSGTKNCFEWFQLYNTVFHCTVLHRPYWVHFLWLLEIAPWGNKCKKVSQQCTFEPQLCQLVVLFKTFGKEVSIKDLFDGKTNHNVTTITVGTTLGLELLQKHQPDFCHTVVRKIAFKS